MNDKPSHAGFVLAGLLLFPAAFGLTAAVDRDWGFVQRAVYDGFQRDAALAFSLTVVVSAVLTATLGSLGARTRAVAKWSMAFVAAATLAIAYAWFHSRSATEGVAYSTLRDLRDDAAGGAASAVGVGAFAASTLATLASFVFGIDARVAKRARFDGRRFVVLALTLVIVLVGIANIYGCHGVSLAAFPATVGIFSMTLGDLEDDAARAAAGASLLHAVLAVLLVAVGVGTAEGRVSRFLLVLVSLAPLLLVPAILSPRAVFGGLATAVRRGFGPVAIAFALVVTPWLLRGRVDASVTLPFPNAVQAALPETLGSEDACHELVLDDLLAIRGDRILLGQRDVGSITMLDDDGATAKLVRDGAPPNRDAWLEIDPTTSGPRFTRLLTALERSRNTRFDDGLVSSALAPMSGCGLHIVGRHAAGLACEATTIAASPCLPSNEDGIRVAEVTPGEKFALRDRALRDIATEHHTESIKLFDAKDFVTTLTDWWKSLGSHRDPSDTRFDMLVLDVTDEPVGDLLKRAALSRSITRPPSVSASGRSFYYGTPDAAFDLTIGTRHALDRKPRPPPPIDTTESDSATINYCRHALCTHAVIAAAYRGEAEKAAEKPDSAEEARRDFRAALLFDPSITPRTNDPRVARAFAGALLDPYPNFVITSVETNGIDESIVRAMLESVRAELRRCENRGESRLNASVDLDGSVIARGCLGETLESRTFAPRDQPASFQVTIEWPMKR